MLPMYRDIETLWILINFHRCRGTTSLKLPFTEWAALRTVSRCSRRSCSEEVRVVVPRRWPVSVHLILSTLNLLTPF